MHSLVQVVNVLTAHVPLPHRLGDIIADAHACETKRDTLAVAREPRIFSLICEDLS